MEVKITDRIERKLREEHGLEWDDVLTIFEEDADRLDFKTGDTGISFGVTESGWTITAITIKKGNTKWLKTARYMTDAEKRIFRKARR
jgi:hypothetical protein